MKTTQVFCAFALVLLLATACVPSSPTNNATLVPAMTVMPGQNATISALETKVAYTPNTPTASPYVPPTATIAPSRTPAPSNTPVVLVSVTPVPSATSATRVTPNGSTTPEPVRCNRATFIEDVTIPDGTQLTPGKTFTKTWRLRNDGTCTWTTDYKVVLVSSDAFNSPASANLSSAVPPGETVDISLEMTAPSSTGIYRNYYRLADADGNIFGTGAGGTGLFYVYVSVGATSSVPTSTSFAVNHVTLSANTTAAVANCPPGYTFTLNAKIETTAAGDVSYYWVFGDGTQSAEKTITFSDAGDQTVSTTWTLGASGALPSNPYNTTVRLYINVPNHQHFGSLALAIGCVKP